MKLLFPIKPLAQTLVSYDERAGKQNHWYVKLHFISLFIWNDLMQSNPKLGGNEFFRVARKTQTKRLEIKTTLVFT